ncbi:DDB1- and CUL4-associated factor homolog 1 isoform X2 [Cynara cardunculus var. scolymus]|uniref:DDB1- and CUL4-associated factor homolog 1 isoform X2 n=1 Tax=Cynara cardunculus var. scolymus TaxID=59895 RepID=UPI000D62B1BF|nr:DDB1- and CUL4-associated factor homolog 1 isoform X2 [Cynara cardunculus var. scolymus]
MEAATDDHLSEGAAAPPPPPPPPGPTPPVEEDEEDEEYEEEEEEEDDEEEETNNEDEILIAKAQGLIDKITASPDNPKPLCLHALASILETQEARYMEETGHTSINNGRASHNIGRLGNLLRDNDEFFELISAKFLSETRYSVAVQAAALRLLFSCSLTWMYPHVFEETVLENIKSWVMDGTTRSSAEDHKGKNGSGARQSSDSEMMKTYSTGLLAVCLAGGGQVVEDVLTSGLSAKLMRYLRIRVLGEASTSQKESNYLLDSKSSSAATSIRAREDNRGRFRHASETSQLEPPRITEEGTSDDQVTERDRNRSFIRQTCTDDRWAEPPDGFDEDNETHETDTDGHVRDLRDGKTKVSDRSSHGKSLREDEIEESGRDDLSRRRANRGLVRSRGKGRINEGIVENEHILTSPGSGSRFGGQGRSIKDRSSLRSLESKRVADVKKSSVRIGADALILERDDCDDCFQDCKVGSKDISDLVKKAVRAAEAEARAANASAEAIKAARDAAAELVKTAALEEFKRTNDEEAAVLSASRAASTVVDAANATEVSRSHNADGGESANPKEPEPETTEEVEEFFILDCESLAKLREKFCIQCLEILGEYIEVLGPVLHEKGVDVCLALLQRNSDLKEASQIAVLLPDVLKLICALAAHRKFAALFVDRGGIQKLLALPRESLTFYGLSSCLFAIGSLQGIMERVCALPSDVIHQLIALALQLLECSQDQARKNAALFFANAFVFRAVLDAFDNQDGLQKLLKLLGEAASVRAGVSSGTVGSSTSGSLRNDRTPPEVLTSSEKQIAYHTTVALRQYFRAHLLLLVDSIRPSKNFRSAARNIPSSRAAYKPLDISNEAIDAVFRQIQKDRKLGPAFVRARWPAVDKFLNCNGHITMLELCQAPPVERYLHDLLQYALGVLHIVTLVPYSRKLVVSATLSNDRLGIAVILDAANGAGFVDPEIIQPALNVLVNLVCPPPSISNKPTMPGQGQTSNAQTSNAPSSETRERNADRNTSELNSASLNEPRDRNGESSVVDRGTAAALGTSFTTSGLVGDRRISLGAGAGCAGLAAQVEQGYRQAREAVRANNGIKVLLQLLQPRIITPSTALDCLRALACRVLLGLARDDTIAHILTKLQVGKKLSELIRDSGSQTPGGEQGRWQTELSQVAIELMAIVTNSGRASTLAATDAATPTLRRIERAAIAAATPITYHSRELLLLIHEHLQASGLSTTASALLKEAQLTPLQSLAAPSSLAYQTSGQESSSVQIQWPAGRSPCGFLTTERSKQQEDSNLKQDSSLSVKRRPLVISSALGQSKISSYFNEYPSPSSSRIISSSKKPPPAAAAAAAAAVTSEASSTSTVENQVDSDSVFKTPIILPLKRKLTELRDVGPPSSSKRLNTSDLGFRSPVCPTPNTVRKSSLLGDTPMFSTSSSFKDLHWRTPGSVGISDGLDDNHNTHNHGLPLDPQSTSERLTLDSIVVQYLKHQHRQCPAPITTLPPLSLLHPHVCPESKRSLDAPSNITARLNTREFRNMYGGIHGSRRDRQFVYSRFRPWRTCRDDTGVLLTCITFLGDSSQIAAGSHSGELKVFDSNSNNMLESSPGHQFPLTMVKSFISGDTQLLLSSSSHDVRLWDAPTVSAGPRYSFDGIKAATFSHCGTMFAALSSELSRREILLYDVQTCKSDLKLTDQSSSASSKGHAYSQVHFSPSDIMLLWNGVLWDRRVPGPVHRFDQFTDYGGGGFHPAGNEVIINSEVWDLRNFRLLRSVPSLDQTVITFNASGDVIYAILRRNLEEVTSAFQTRRVKHPLFSAFRTLDAVNYSDIATIPVDRCVLDFATEPTDSFVGLVTMDDQDEMYSSSRVYEIGRRKPTDDDSDPDDAESEEEDEDEDDEDIDEDALLGNDEDGDDMSNDEDSLSDLDDDDEGDDGDFVMDGMDFDGEGGIFEIMTDGEDGDEDDDGDDDELIESLSSGDDEDFIGGF